MFQRKKVDKVVLIISQDYLIQHINGLLYTPTDQLLKILHDRLSDNEKHKMLIPKDARREDDRYCIAVSFPMPDKWRVDPYNEESIIPLFVKLKESEVSINVFGASDYHHDSIYIENSQIILSDYAALENIKMENCFVRRRHPLEIRACTFTKCSIETAIRDVRYCYFDDCYIDFTHAPKPMGDLGMSRISSSSFSHVQFCHSLTKSRYFGSRIKANTYCLYLYLEGVKFSYCKNRIYCNGALEYDVTYFGCTEEETPLQYLAKNFHHINGGWIGFKNFDSTSKPFRSPNSWNVVTGSIITEISDSNRGKECSYGISFGSLAYMLEHYRGLNGNGNFRAIYIPDEYATEITVPYFTDGKCRTSYCEICTMITLGNNSLHFTSSKHGVIRLYFDPETYLPTGEPEYL